MRVGFVTPRYPPAVAGGGEISVKLFADQLSKRGEDVTIYSFDGGSQEVVDGVSVRRFRSLPHGVLELSNCYAGYALWSHCEELSSLDLLHAYNVTLTPVTGWLSSRLSVPSVATLNSYDLLQKSSFDVTPDAPRRLYELLAMPTTGRFLRHEAMKVDRFVTLSQSSKQLYKANNFDNVPIDVVPNMLDPSFDVPENIDTGAGFELLYVGSLIAEKGVSYLVRAMAALPEDVTLRVVGSGGQEEHLKSIAHDVGIHSRIEFEGQVPYAEIRRYYASADCFVHPGVWPEPFGRTILEAMQAGLPVVTTNVGGPAELVPQEELRCEPRCPSALAKAVTAARGLSDAGAENRAHVTERFSPSTVVNRLYDVYEQAIESS